MHYTAMREEDYKYPKIDVTKPREEGWLPVSDGHEIHWQEFGNKDGIPLVIIHGGPGGGIMPDHLRIADPEKYRIIAFDQRGCGKSRPHVEDNAVAAMTNNTTQATIDDIEALLAHRQLKDQKVQVYGGSWGTTVAIAYAEQHPEHVANLILRGIFLCDQDDLSFFYQGNAKDYHKNPHDTSLPGAYRAYISNEQFTVPEKYRNPLVAEQYREAWDKYVNFIPVEERGDMIGAYHKRLRADSTFSEQERLAAATAWAHWEEVTSFLNKIEDKQAGKPAQEEAKGDGDFGNARHDLAFSTIENTYFHRALQGKDPVITDLLKPENIARLKGIPTHVRGGEFDEVCVPSSAHKFKHAMNEHGDGLASYKETLAGHALTEKETFQEVSGILDGIAKKKSWGERRPPAPLGRPADDGLPPH